MSLTMKYLLTAIALIFGLVVLLIKPKKDNAGPDAFWRFGREDLLRNLFFNRDGSLKKIAKPLIFSFIGVWLLLVWFLAPTQ